MFTNLFLYLTILVQVMGQVSPDHALFSVFFQYESEYYAIAKCVALADKTLS
ncbi:hypothetical protein [Vibrio qinghaiensis]|uniref:hypothetical protein n=1 Tax=Vibrio qinghaiensis TaxID=2025808 RepID=UPI0012FD1EA6|nr:hypothetical protein [Vibrio qinghaiensis]